MTVLRLLSHSIVQITSPVSSNDVGLSYHKTGKSYITITIPVLKLHFAKKKNLVSCERLPENDWIFNCV